MLVKALKAYVRQILDYNNPIRSPSFVKDILLIESVQRKFTERISGMSGLTYHSQLTRLGLASLGVRRPRADILLVYKILFGMVRVNGNEFFTLIFYSAQLHPHSTIWWMGCCILYSEETTEQSEHWPRYLSLYQTVTVRPPPVNVPNVMSLGRIAGMQCIRCGLLLQRSHVAWSVRLSVCIGHG